MNNLFILFFIFVTVACDTSEVKEQEYSGEALGTSYQIKFFHPEELELQKGLDSIFEVINHSMSTYQEDSDISRINNGDTTIRVDENFRKVFMDSYQIYIESRGFFDPTVGNLVNAYGFGPETGIVELDQKEVDSMLHYVGLNKLKLSDDNRIIKDSPEIYLDFNAIAKGYTVDVLASYLQSKGVENLLVEVGGELVAKGKNLERDSPWTVGIDDPLQVEGKRSLTAALRLENRAMATSGNYRKFRVDSTGRRFVHTINPLTGLSEKSNLLSATVLAPTCSLADGYATAFMAMGYEEAVELVKRLEKVDVYFIYSAEEEEVKVYSTPGFEGALLKE